MNTNDKATQSKRLQDAAWSIEGVMYVMDALADERTEATHALRNQARELDRAFSVIYEIAEELADAECEQPA